MVRKYKDRINGSFHVVKGRAENAATGQVIILYRPYGSPSGGWSFMDEKEFCFRFVETVT